MAGLMTVFAARRTIFSWFFLVSAAVWVLFTFIIAVISVGVVSDSSTINSYSIPDSQVSAIIQLDNATISYYGQNFNSYGSGISGTSAYYNLSGGPQTPGTAMHHIAVGYAGITGQEGFLSFNISPVDSSYSFFFNMHIFNSKTGFNFTPSYFISGSSQAYTKGRLSVTPVRSSTNGSNFGLHVFTSPGTTYSNAKVFYEKEPYFSPSSNVPSYFNYSRTVHVETVNISRQMNIATPIQLNGDPYFYEAGINGSTGGTIGSTFFSTLPTPANEAHEAWGFIFAVSAIIGVPCAFVALTVLSDPVSGRNGKPSRFMPGALKDDNSQGKSTVFARRMGVSLLAIIPLVAVTAIFSEAVSSSAYGVIIPLREMLAISAGLLLTMLLGASYASILLGAGLQKAMSKESPGYGKVQWRSFALIAPIIAAMYFMIFRNFQLSFTHAVNPASVVPVNFLNPFGYILLIQQKLTGSLLFGGTLHV